MFLYGRNSIVERVKRNPQTIKKIFLQKDFNDGLLLKEIKNINVPIIYKDISHLQFKKFSNRAYKIAAEVSNFQYASFKDIINTPDDKKPVLIFLDNITDPQNLGSIIRTSGCFGNFGIVIPKQRACEINETVLAVAEGGENHVPVCMVTNLTYSIIEAKKHGYWIMGAVMDKGTSIFKTSFLFPLSVVLGSENRGIHPGMLKHIDLKVSIPMSEASLSFNVAIAASIFCYEASRQKNTQL
ncbi:MAG: 23S rRNA (guanosine(2251)-2'-O)-methyltransferase RlmB [Candidatus Omnitrophica bacterium]|nr:23S rRNA (guanosine(2251)-2'-O)-methyltransferase RlmB [Candidatus Omnitrophota bacterium]